MMGGWPHRSTPLPKPPTGTPYLAGRRRCRCRASAGVDPVGGLFQEALSLEGRPIDAPRRARAQARQVFAFASAASAGYGAAMAFRWRATAGHASPGPPAPARWPVHEPASGDRTPVDADADIYEQTFVMLAMAALQAPTLGPATAQARPRRSSRPCRAAVSRRRPGRMVLALYEPTATCTSSRSAPWPGSRWADRRGRCSPTRSSGRRAQPIVDSPDRRGARVLRP